MQVFDNLKHIFFSKIALLKQLSLFSLVGLGVLFFVKSLALYLNLLFLSQGLYISAPHSNMELLFYIFVTCILAIYFVGYLYQFIHNIMNEKYDLPDISSEVFYYFVKMIPFNLCWGFYLGLIFILWKCFFLISGYDSSNYLAGLLTISLLPFVFIIQAGFFKNFKYCAEFFDVIKLIPIVLKNFWRVLVIFVQILILSVLSLWGAIKILSYSVPNTLESFVMKLVGLCILAYLTVVVLLAYQLGVCNIAKRYFK